MSEIKGQLLGMLLVLAAFAVIGGILMTTLNKTASDVSGYVEQDYSWNSAPQSSNKAEILSYFD